MADIVKVLAQDRPAITNLTDLYTVPGGRTAVISSVTVCNFGANSNWRLSISIGGAADDPKQYLYYDMPHSANDTFIATIGITLSAGDVVRVYSGSGDISFNLFGVEEA
jgi:hypothetical protein